MRRDGIHSTCEQAGVRWESTEEEEESRDRDADAFLHVVVKQVVESLFVASIFLMK